jgi:hypothetical protein
MPRKLKVLIETAERRIYVIHVSNSELSILRVGGQAFFAAFELKS